MTSHQSHQSHQSLQSSTDTLIGFGFLMLLCILAMLAEGGAS